MAQLAEGDRELAQAIAGLPWFVDDITEDERWAIRFLAQLTETDGELAQRIAGLPWFVDDIRNKEWRGIRELAAIASNDPEQARVRLEELNEEYS